MFDFHSILESVFTALQGLISTGVVQLITQLFAGLFPAGWPADPQLPTIECSAGHTLCHRRHEFKRRMRWSHPFENQEPVIEGEFWMSLKKMTSVMKRVGLGLALAGAVIAGGCAIPGLDQLSELLGGLFAS
jgi:hypothetical protein